MSRTGSIIEFEFKPLGGHLFRLKEINSNNEWEMELKDGRGEIYEVPTLRKQKECLEERNIHEEVRSEAAVFL